VYLTQSHFLRLILKELLLAYRHRSECLNGILFFILITSLFPLVLVLDEVHLQLMSAGVIWIAALFATLLSLPRLFQTDFEDGTLAQLLLSPLSINLLVMAKVIAHWLMFGMPLILLTPCMALLFHLNAESMWILSLTLVIGTPLLHLLGAFIAALTLGLRQAGVLLSLILIPLFIPPLIFATQAVIAAIQKNNIWVPILLLTALLSLALTLMPYLTGKALRISVNYDR